MSNRILDYPEATEITSNDYILLDNEGTGAKCIKASALNINMDNYTIKEARGAIASFDDGEDLPLAFMGAYITAIQDLHGYDYPWVGGSGKNKYGGTFTLSGLSNNDGTFTNTITDSRTYFSFAVQTYNGNTLVSNASKPIGETGRTSLTLDVTSEVTQLRIKHSGSARDLYVDIPFTLTGQFTISLDVVGCNPSVVGGLVFKDVQVESGNTATTYEPYSNICPISGWDEVNVTRCGKNLCGELEIGTFAESSQIGSTYDEMKVANGARIRIKWLIPTFNNNIVISCDFANYQYCFCLYDANKKYLGQTDGFGSWRSIAYTPTTPSSYIAIVLKRNDGATITSDDLENCHLQVELGTTATTYEAYNGNTYTIDLNGTRYGGYVDLVSGVLTVDRVYKQVKDFEWRTQGGNYGRFFTVPSGADKALFESNKTLIISDTYKGYSDASKPANTNGVYVGSGGSIKIWDSEYTEETDIDAWKTARANAELCYYLATPLTYSLSKQQIKSLVGENNIFADTGDSIVDYRKLWVKPEM